MNYSIVKALILKDWYLQRWILAGLAAGGVAALATLSVGGEAAGFAGLVLLITVMIILGVYVSIALSVNERKDQTLAFVMSLPVSPRDFTASKMIGGTMLLLVPWLILLLSSCWVILRSPYLPDGLIPYITVTLTELLASAFVLLAVAMVTESQAWTVAVMTCGNLFVNAFMFWVSRIPSISQEMKGSVPVWSEIIVKILVSEVAVIAAALSLTFYFQNRKTDYL